MNQMQKAERIVIIDLLYLGDLLFATPFFRNLKKNFPQARIDLVANANFAEIIEDNPHLEQVYAYDKDWGLTESWSFARELSGNDYDLGLNIHGNWRTALLLKIINPKYSVGYGTKGRGVFLDQTLTPVEAGHMVDNYLALLPEIDLDIFDDAGQELGINDSALESMEQFLTTANTDENKIIGLNTGASWPTKRWPCHNWANLADKLIKQGAKVVFFGGPGDVDRVDQIVNMMEEEPIVAAGKTNLKELAALASLCDLFISGDSGPVHVAASVDTPTIAIFGPSDEKKYHPYGENHQVIKTELDCRPCGEHECPLEHHQCMENISAEEVLSCVL
ncbi:lipopolysaccharide heptosyltransferase II [Halobacteroides halobius DSM 5150]|uniref:lipopolysaccharide heptosyltransferase II n=1 Tax=Halobacteroides halobius (strain ATCC 35273 / DSM 5150 / MD-1) TaxID=748449 RepID=L0KD19_HALHC|nr:lipopolysaccharide heptosyltransferase II [Halobacteroides halobius]AGB42274.1 lipopolysaccharide heptosyltransferase II [Halobacteroides halobius DSM 5150]